MKGWKSLSSDQRIRHSPSILLAQTSIELWNEYLKGFFYFLYSFIIRSSTRSTGSETEQERPLDLWLLLCSVRWTTRFLASRVQEQSELCSRLKQPNERWKTVSMRPEFIDTIGACCAPLKKLVFNMIYFPHRNMYESTYKCLNLVPHLWGLPRKIVQYFSKLKNQRLVGRKTKIVSIDFFVRKFSRLKNSRLDKILKLYRSNS